ncbi:clusterin [Hypomesus transpacificus]|uniref:clusterin n=1 Tax=Hypomesus transpacificus TaxID=137520 RepID=UPI001F079C7D|nr:clusterin [Hypomesus transpacificus]
MLMMIMMKRKLPTRLLGVAMLLVSAHSLLPPSSEELKQISQLGEKYLDKQIDNAINGVKEMKTVMEKSGEEHKNFLSALEKTKQQKEDALRKAQQMEEKLNEEQEVCNETMQALWEECKPCLKNTCVKFYSRTCSSGAGMVGRQLERVLNRTSPFSIWINGQNMDVLEQEDRRQSQEFQNLEERFSEVAEGVDSIFLDSMKVFDHMRSLNPGPLFPSPFRMPSLWQGAGQEGQGQVKVAAELDMGGSRVRRSPFQGPMFHGFHDTFFPMMDMAKNIFGSMGPLMDPDSNLDAIPSEDGSVNEDVVLTRPFGNGQMTCREIRRNSAGCINLREECEKCKEIQSVDCSGKKPLEGPIKKELEQALAMAERFTQEYNFLLREFEEKMLNTSSLLDLFNHQFGWVSSLANSTKTKDGIFRIKTVISQDNKDTSDSNDTSVSVQLFDAPPMTFSVPGDISWSDPKFYEVVAQGALERYKQTTVVA